MATLNYSGTADGLSKGHTTSLIAQTINLNGASDGISVDSVSLRVTESGVRVMLSVSINGTVSELETLADTIAQGAVDLGLEPDTQTAREAISISGEMD